jgi:DNA-binding LacI/PurR family transcriptional regulator
MQRIAVTGLQSIDYRGGVVLTRSPTIRDVAQQARVSESTVSRVLSNSETAVAISQETRQRVVAVAEALGYQPHPFARALRGKGVNLLGVIVREIDDPFFAQLIEAIGNTAKEQGYDLVLGCAKSDPEEALALSEILDSRHTDGLFLLGDLNEPPEDHSFLIKMGRACPILSVCRGSRELASATPSIAVDSRKGALLALSYLASLGHRRIAHINASRLGDLRERMEVYREFMRDQFGECPQDCLQMEENSYDGGYRAARRLLSLPCPPTAIFATDDTMAVGTLSAAADAGVVVPRDLSVVGFDNIKIAAYLRPALTTVCQPIEIIASQAVDMLVKMVKGDTTSDPLAQVLIEPELIVRDSCAPPSARLIN